MPAIRQDSFAGGLLSEQFLGKASQQKYATGLRVCTNFWITRQGNAENRPGTQFCGEVKDSAHTLRIAPFVFSQTVSYLLEIGDDYFRPWRNGARVAASPAPAYAGGTTYVQGDFVTSVGIIYRSLASGNVGHTPAANPTWWNPQTDGKVTVVTVIPQASLTALQYVQQNDIMTLVDQGIPPQQFLRFSDAKWQQQAFALNAGIAAPTGVMVTIGVGPSPTPTAPTGLTAVGGDGFFDKDRYVVTAFLTTGEGAQSAAAVATVGKATAVNPVVLAWTAVGGVIGYAIYKEITPALPSGVYGIISTVDTNAYTDAGLVSATAVKVSAGSSPGNTTFTYVVTTVSATTGAESLASAEATGVGRTPSDAHPNVISWGAVADAARYNIYRVVNSIPGFIGAVASPTLSFSDTNFFPDTAIQPPVPLTLFSTSNDYPAVVGFFQQRIGFANTINNPQGMDFSRVGNIYNFTVSTPLRDEDAESVTLAGKQVQAVRALVDLGRLVVHTSSAEYVAQGNQSGALSPLAPAFTAQGSSGATAVAPVVIGNTDLFVQARGGFLRDLRYEIQSTSYAGKDTTIYSPDLFANRTIVSMDWQQVPNSIVWVVLNDGTLLGLTYLREQDVWAWHEHDLSGDVENVCVVPESTEDVVYLVVKRTINGATKRYIERLANRAFATINDAVFCDASLAFDGRNTGVITMTATTAGGWTSEEDLTLTASAGYFVAGDVSNAIVLQQIATDGTVTDQVTLTIIHYTSTTVVTVQADKTVPTWAQVALTTWGKAVHHFTGLSHLEAKVVTGLGDGNVMPNATVASGAITTARNYLRLTVGLPITANLETLPLENTQGETIANKKILVTELTASFYQTRGTWTGEDADHLYEWTQRQLEGWSDPVSLFTGTAIIGVQGAWQKTGQIYLQQRDPLPVGLSAVAVSAFVGN